MIAGGGGATLQDRIRICQSAKLPLHILVDFGKKNFDFDLKLSKSSCKIDFDFKSPLNRV